MITFYSCLHLYDFWHPCPLFRGFTADQFEHNHGSIAHYYSPATSYAHNATQLRRQGWIVDCVTEICLLDCPSRTIIQHPSTGTTLECFDANTPGAPRPFGLVESSGVITSEMFGDSHYYIKLIGHNPPNPNCVRSLRSNDLW